MPSNINKNAMTILQKFLSAHKENYFIIGGHAAAYNLSLQGLSFRVTRDYDIVIVSEVEDEQFADDLAKLLESGGYRFGYKADNNKRIAYRFEHPSDTNYPEIIEFFVKEGEYIQSIDNRFAKLNIVVDENKISAMVLDKDIYGFAKNHTIEINELIFVDRPCLIALKAFAYFENLRLYKDHKVKSDDYKKHIRDILRIIGSFSKEDLVSISDLPNALKEAINEIIPVLIKSKEQLKALGLDEETVVFSINSLIN